MEPGVVQLTDTPWLKTPLVYSKKSSERLGHDVYFKHEHRQKTKSFKYRGMCITVKGVVEKHGKDAHIFIASGGNGGRAAAAVAQDFGLKCTVYVAETTSQHQIQSLRSYGAGVELHGQNYGDAREAAAKAVKADPKAVLLSTYEDPGLWLGHSSIVHEIQEQLFNQDPASGGKPDAIVCAIGGGGLLGGIMRGCEDLDWQDVVILGVETRGADCFYHSIHSHINFRHKYPPDIEIVPSSRGETHHAYQKVISSKACLGAPSPSVWIMTKALVRNEKFPAMDFLVVPDALSEAVARSYADENDGEMIELAAATALAPAYYASLFHQADDNTRGCFQWELAEKRYELRDKLGKHQRIVFIVCGAGISDEEFQGYASAEEQWTSSADGSSDQAADRGWPVEINGESHLLQPSGDLIYRLEKE